MVDPKLAEDGGKQKTGFRPVSPGFHSAACVDLIDLGLALDAYGRERERVRLVFQVSERLPSGQRMTVSKTFTRSMHERSALRRDLEDWRGRKFTETEARAFDLEKVVGIAATLVIENRTTKTKGFLVASISEIRPAEKGQELHPDSYTRKRDRRG